MRNSNASDPLSVLQQQVKMRPTDFAARHSLGIAYLERGMNREGLTCFRQLVATYPNQARARCSLAWALLHVGSLEEARSEYAKARQLDPRSADALSGEAEALYRLGRLQETYDRILTVLTHKPFNVDDAAAAIRIYSKICGRYGDCTEALELLTQLTTSPTATVAARVSAGFALGALNDRLAHYGDAFEAYRTANSLSAFQYSHELDRARNDLVLDAFSAPVVHSLSRAKNVVRRPVFIVGMPRSGTSLVEQILSRHLQVFGGGELSTINDIANALHSQFGYPQTLSGLTSGVLHKAATHYLSVTKKLTPRPVKRITDKMPANFLHLGLIYLLFPKATIIHVCRNPLDTCLSIYFQPLGPTHTYSTDLRNIALYYREHQRIMEHWGKVLELNILRVSYEELVTNQEAVSRAIVAHCGLSWDGRCLNFFDSDRVVTTASHDQVKQPMYMTSMDRWRNYEQSIDPLLEVFGNTPSE